MADSWWFRVPEITRILWLTVTFNSSLEKKFITGISMTLHVYVSFDFLKYQSNIFSSSFLAPLLPNWLCRLFIFGAILADGLVWDFWAEIF